MSGSEWNRKLIWLLVACLSMVSGCHRDPADRFHINGTITFENHLIEGGIVLFEPDMKAGNDGPQGIANIQGGRYSTRGTQKGVTEGPHIVRIRGFRREDSGAVVPLFPEYETEVELHRERTTYDFIVPVEAIDGQDVQPHQPT